MTDDTFRTPRPKRWEARPNQHVIEGALRQQIEALIGPGALASEMIGRVESTLGPVLALVDVPVAASDDLNMIFGSDRGLRARIAYDPVLSMLANAVLSLRRELDRIDPDANDRVAADADARLAANVGAGMSHETLDRLFPYAPSRPGGRNHDC